MTVSGIKWILDGTPFERRALRRGDRTTTPSGAANSTSQKQKLRRCSRNRSNSTSRCCIAPATNPSKSRSTRWRGIARSGLADEARADRTRRRRDCGPARQKSLASSSCRTRSHFVDASSASDGDRTCSRCDRCSMLDLLLALGSDGPMNPFLNILFATTHPYAPTQAITRERAVSAYTHGSAFEIAEDRNSRGGKAGGSRCCRRMFLAAPAPELPESRSSAAGWFLMGGSWRSETVATAAAQPATRRCGQSLKITDASCGFVACARNKIAARGPTRGEFEP